VIVLLDTDVLVDVALNRAPHAEASAGLLDLLERRSGSAFVAWHTIANFYYLVAPTRGGRPTRDFVLDLLRFAEAAPASTEALRKATRLQMKDFEDAMQVVAAEACGADVIATRNIRDYARSPLRAATPKVLVSELL
jgi:predicted nucleic acid-binding protein